MKIRPTKDLVVIERDEAEEKVGSFVLPDRAKQKPHEGKVVAVGPGRWGRRLTLGAKTVGMAEAMHGHGDVREEPFRLPMTLKVGDRVMWGRYTELGVPDGFLGDDAMGVDFTDDQLRNLVVISESDILCVVEEEDDGGHPE
jgi:co-chaperonin GroES (HSP10)